MMSSNSTTDQLTDYQRIATAIRYIEMNHQAQPSLEDIAEHLHLSPAHVQRLFRRWAGISPKRFLQYLTVEHAKQLLSENHSVLDATYEAGLSSPGRLHDLFVNVEAVTPGEYKSGGAGIDIAYGFHDTPFGECLLATTARGICGLLFTAKGIDDETPELAQTETLQVLQKQWSAAILMQDESVTQPLIDQIFLLDQKIDHETTNISSENIRLLLKGTNFQLQVWRALLDIPLGSVCAYGDIATHIGKPKASRAVGSAVGANAIAYLIPCHRVIRKSGMIKDYRWGSTRKKALLGWEQALREGAMG
ncbi:MAG: methylated-DNA--[protein]-cysteine S-methyltransferase [Chloroflexota bacterium]